MTEQPFYKQDTLPGLESVLKEEIPPLPDTIGPYKIEGLLSKGGASLLYLGINPDTKRTLVVKTLSPEFVNHPEMISRFLQEAKVISMTDHPNIVKLYGEGEWEQGLYIAMEFIHGVSLRQFIAYQALSLKRSLDIILQVAYALCHLHTHSVVHRDLKPENILIDEEGSVKVIDFGIAQLHSEPLETSRETSRLLGTPDYMSPEQKRDPLSASYPTDIYSLGIIAYELITGKFSRGAIHIPLLPKGLQPIITKALAPDLEQRYQDIVPFISDLSAYLKSGSIEKERPGGDLWREAIEVTSRAEAALSPRTTPDWPHAEIGLARRSGSGEFGLYYDLLRLSDGSYGAIMAKPSSKGLDGAIYTANLRGILLSLMHIPKEPFSPLQILEKLNTLLLDEGLGEKFTLSFLNLNPRIEQMTFIACGDDYLLHTPAGSEEVRKISSHNALLGTSYNEIFASQDNWNIGDRILFSSLSTEETDRTPTLVQEFQNTTMLSPNRAAEKILSEALSSQIPTDQQPPRALLLINRVG